jgi:plastocyanin
MTRLIRPLLVAAIATTALVPTAGPAQAGGDTEITLAATQFTPNVVQVPAGNSLSFTNKDVTNYPALVGNHNVIPDSNVGGMVPGTKPFPTSSDLITPGTKWTCSSVSGGLSCTGIDKKPTLVPPGTYTVACGLHPNQMHAVIVVQ